MKEEIRMRLDDRRNQLFQKGGKPGPGRRKLTEEQKELEYSTVEKVQKVYRKRYKIANDWAAEAAKAVFVGNLDKIYRVFSKALLRGDPKVFTALANRAFGMPAQELAFSQNKPLQVEINFLGQKRTQPLAVEKALGAQKIIEGEIKANEEEDAESGPA